MWTAKQKVLDRLAKDLMDAINYGLVGGRVAGLVRRLAAVAGHESH